MTDHELSQITDYEARWENISRDDVLDGRYLDEVHVMADLIEIEYDGEFDIVDRATACELLGANVVRHAEKNIEREMMEL